MKSISSSSMPSSPIGPNSSTSGTASAAAKTSSKPRMASTRSCGLGMRLTRGVKDGDAGALGADQGAGDVEAVLGQKGIEVVVAGDAARNLRKARADEIAITLAEGVERHVDFAAAAAFRHDRREFLGIGRADRHPQPVIGEDVERAHIVRSAPRHDRMDAARIVADHAAERVVIVGRRIRSEGQVVLFGGVAQPIENAAGLDARQPRLRVEVRARSCRYLEKSMRTAALQPWPARLVPPPRITTGAPSLAAFGNRGDHVVGGLAERRRRAAPGGSSRHRWRTARGCRNRSGPRRDILLAMAAASASASPGVDWKSEAMRPLPARLRVRSRRMVDLDDVMGHGSGRQPFGIGLLEGETETGARQVGCDATARAASALRRRASARCAHDRETIRYSQARRPRSRLPGGGQGRCGRRAAMLATSASAAARRKPVMPPQRVASACSTSTAPASSMRPK